MIKNLVKLASYLDSKGLTKEADFLDAIILKTSGITPDGNYDEDYSESVSSDKDYKNLDQIAEEIYYDEKEEYTLDTATRFLEEIKKVSKNPLVNSIPEPTADDVKDFYFEYEPWTYDENADEDLKSLAAKISWCYRHLVSGPFRLESRNYMDVKRGTEWIIKGLELADALGLGKDLEFAKAAMQVYTYDSSELDLSEEKSEAGSFEGDIGSYFSPNSDINSEIAEDLTIDSNGLSKSLDPFVETWGKDGKVSVTSVIEKLKEFSEDIESSVELGMDEADRWGFGGNKEEIARDAAEELGVKYEYIEYFDDYEWYSRKEKEEERKECIHKDLLEEMLKYQDN